ncbi:hypothetical protein GGQ80_000509 [Sphingomonas jinjuensis]|uniref:Uncharacterized protein n=1 Tax=Sphingomonas jinjuensis TaxID=535907 RepID=A0A840F043_9SPHN|nr:hypothetical protein [Sphingomonas jinjuensis]MBB4152633.1 hypothetical protein [Sphingomonas jinjuensis]
MTLALLSLLLLQSGPAAPPQKAEVPPLQYDLVVTGVPDLDEADSAVTRKTLGSSKVGNATKTRIAFQTVETFTRCGGEGPSRGLGWLRAALDTTTNTARQIFAQRRFITLNAACSASAQQVAEAGTVIDYYSDRGGLYLMALDRFAPNPTLTKAETADPVIQKRFDQREIPLLAKRLPVDRRYFEAAICFVRLQPELSVKLVQPSTKFAAYGRIEAAIVNGAKPCTGNARRVYFDPTQFRYFIADALYRWVVAARDVDTLVPAALPGD